MAKRCSRTAATTRPTRSFSVGLLSKALALQRAIEQGKTRFDFLRGHERYKYELGAQDLNVHKVLIRYDALWTSP